jgi:hypothetical protein
MLIVRGALGILTGIVLAPFIFIVSLIRGARAVHAQGVLCQAEVTAIDAVVGPRLAGPALARLSGAFVAENGAKPDIVGLALRLRKDAAAAPEVGDQDLLLASFESFATAGKDKRATRIDDYLANEYDTVSPWRVDGLGVVRLRATPPAPPNGTRPGTRTEKLAADIEAGTAELTLGTHPNDGNPGPVSPIARIKLTAVSDLEARRLRERLGRDGRGLTAVGFRNGIRRVVYPVSQAARTIRGG